MPHTVFISYSSRDRQAALQLKEMFESDGHDAWMDLFDIQPAARLVLELEAGVRTADVLCLVVSPSAISSPWVDKEIECALAAEAKGVRILPVIIRPATIPGKLADLVAIDATQGLDDPAVSLRIRRALGADIVEGVLLDAVKRAELADRAAIEAAEEALPSLQESLARVMDAPIRSLTVEVDQDSWPGKGGTVIEIVLDIDMFLGSMHILLAPYVEGHTWPRENNLDERSPAQFIGLCKPRVDARLLWAGRTLTANQVGDATDLQELPMQFTFELKGDEYTGLERAHTMALLERFELPSLRKLIDSGSSVTVWLHRQDGSSSAVKHHPATTDLHLRLQVPLQKNQTGLAGFRLWGHYDRLDQVLCRAPTLREAKSELHREAVLSLHRNVPLRAHLNSHARRERITKAVEGGTEVAEGDRWPAFNFAVSRGTLQDFRGNASSAAQCFHDAVRYIEGVEAAELDYAQAFSVQKLFTLLVEALSRAGGTREAMTHYADAAVAWARRLSHLHPDEPDYARAVARSLMKRVELSPAAPGATEYVDMAVASIQRLVDQEALPWRLEELTKIRQQAESMLAKANSRDNSTAEEIDDPLGLNILRKLTERSERRRP